MSATREILNMLNACIISCTEKFTLVKFCVLFNKTELNHNLLQCYLLHSSPNSLFSFSMSSEKSRNDQITILHSSGLEVGQWVTLVIDSSQHTWIHCCASALVTIYPCVLDQCLSLHGQPVTPSTDRSILHIGKSYIESATRHEYPWHLATLCHCRDTDFYLKKKKGKPSQVCHQDSKEV